MSSSEGPDGDSDNDDEEQEESEEEDITGKQRRSSSEDKFFQYFKNASKTLSKTASQGPTLDGTCPPLAYKKKRPQQDLHICLVCNKTISRGNKASRKRHANSNHKNDRVYDCEKAIVRIDHQAAVAAKRKKENDRIHEHALSDENMEVDSSFDNPSTEGQEGDASQSTDIQIENDISDCPDETTSQAKNQRPTVPKVQSTLNVTNEKATNSVSGDLAVIMQKLDLLLEKSPPSSSSLLVEHEKVEGSETGASIKIIKQATCLSDIDGSCFKFYPGEFDGGIIRCEKCFNMICDNSPILLEKDPLYAHRKIKKTPGNSFGAGLLIEKERVEKFITGSNQAWYSFKSMMLEMVVLHTIRHLLPKRKEILLKQLSSKWCAIN